MLMQLKNILKYSIPAAIVGIFFAGIAIAALIRPSALSDLFSTKIQKGQIVVGSSTPDAFTVVNTGTPGTVLQMQSTGFPTFVATSTIFSGGGASLTGGVPGQNAYWTSGTTLGASSVLFDNGTVAGVNASSTSASFNIQGSGTRNPVNVASSSGATYFTILPAGNVGINTSSPTSTLDIYGRGTANILNVSSSTNQSVFNVDVSGNISIRSIASSANALNVYNAAGASVFNVSAVTPATDFFQVQDGAAKVLFEVAVNGGVGVNTSAPVSTFAITGSGTIPSLYIASSSGASQLIVAANGSTTISSLATAGCVNSTATGALWVNTCASGSGTASGTAGSIQFSNGSSAFNADQSNFFWNNTVKFLGINTSSPWANLTVQGQPTNATTTFLFDVASSSGQSNLMVTNSGVVGIGTTNPAAVNANAKLTVAGTGSQDIIASTTDNTTLSDAILQTYAPGSRLFMGAHGINQVSTRYGITLGGWGEIGQFTNGTTTKGLIIGTNPAVPIVFGTNNLERMRIDSTGNVGIGTTTISATLFVQGTTTAGTVSPFVIASSSGANLFTVTPAGRVGIGTATPSTLLNICGTGCTTSVDGISFGGLSDANIWRNGVNTIESSANWVIDQSLGTQGQLYTNNIFASNANSGISYVADRFQVLSGGANSYFLVGYPYATAAPTNGAAFSGNVGIGTTTPLAKLGIQGTTTVDTLDIASSTGTSMLRIKSTGNVGINTTTPAYKFVVAGTVQMSALSTSAANQPNNICQNAAGELVSDTVTAGCVVSSKRYKDEYGSGDYGLDLFLRLPVKSYSFKKNWLGALVTNPNWNGKQEGVFAEDVEKLAPELVNTLTATSTFDGAMPGTADSLKDFSHWIGPITKAFQELNSKVGKTARSAEENWQDFLLGIFGIYIIYNEVQRRRKP